MLLLKKNQINGVSNLEMLFQPLLNAIFQAILIEKKQKKHTYGHEIKRMETIFSRLYVCFFIAMTMAWRIAIKKWLR
jgi:flagellin-specific chaperone FliS